VTFVKIGEQVVHLNMASDRFMRRRVYNCPTCGPDAEMVVQYEEWYGPTTMCCRCGDRWQEAAEPHEWRDARPFKRGWKEDRIAYHRKLWDRATEGPAPTLADFHT
jgi:hypothetical protein